VQALTAHLTFIKRKGMKASVSFFLHYKKKILWLGPTDSAGNDIFSMNEYPGALVGV